MMVGDGRAITVYCVKKIMFVEVSHSDTMLGSIPKKTD
jgi:hypothetical protein